MTDATPDIGAGPATLAANEPKAQAMAKGGYWITDLHALFAGETIFRTGKWKELHTRVRAAGEITLAGDRPFVIEEAEQSAHGARPAVAVRRPPGGTHAVFVAVDDEGDALATMIRTGDGDVSGWAPVVFEGQADPIPPMIYRLDFRSRYIVLGSGEVGPDALRVDLRDRQQEVMAWWGLDASGQIQAFVLDHSGAILRELDRRSPTAEDRRHICNSCPRIANDRASLVRRLDALVAAGDLELEPDTSTESVADAFFAQRDGNLRRWLAGDVPGVVEVFFSD